MNQAALLTYKVAHVEFEQRLEALCSEFLEENHTKNPAYIHDDLAESCARVRVSLLIKKYNDHKALVNKEEIAC